jgi:hypothetical protein
VKVSPHKQPNYTKSIGHLSDACSCAALSHFEYVVVQVVCHVTIRRIYLFPKTGPLPETCQSGTLRSGNRRCYSTTADPELQSQ